MERITGLFYRSPWVAAALFGLLIAAMKWPALALPPVWDEAVSIFPAADFLARHHFDAAAMLRQPECGAHWISLMSLATAAVMSVSQGEAGRILLHLLQWAMGAAACTIFMRMLAPAAGKGAALLAALLFLVAPVTLAQLGYMYIEVPLTLFCVAAVAAHLAGRFRTAALLCLLACFTKETGVLAAAALGCAAVLEGETWAKGVRRACLYVLPGALLAALSAGLVARVDLAPGGLARPELFQRISSAFGETGGLVLRLMPDHAVLLVLALFAAAAVLAGAIRRRLRNGPGALADPAARLLLVSGLFMLGFLAFYFLAVPAVWDLRNYLPRYLVQALPFLIALFVLGAARLRIRPQAVCAALALLAALCLVNRHGLLYAGRPVPSNDVSLAERSEECMDGCLALRDCMQWVAREAPRDVPVLLCPYANSSATHPSFGYVSAPPPNVVNVASDPAFRRLDPDRQPARFFAVDCFPSPGAERIRRLIRAGESPDAPWRMRTCAVFRHGMFAMRAFEFVRKPAPPPAVPAR